MGERKPVNKYLPPDFDPSMVPRSKRPKDGLVSVRMMLPFSIQCVNCGTFMYQGRKFNSKKENMQGPEGKYLGIQRFRFFIKCTSCSRPISFLTDPKNADYEMESGATRNYELRKDQQETEENVLKSTEEEEKEAPLKALENRVLASQREMEEMDALEEIKATNMRNLQMMNPRNAGGVTTGGDMDSSTVAQTTQALLEARDANLLKRKMEATALAAEAAGEEVLNDNGLTESEEALVKSIQFGGSSSGAKAIVRLDERDEVESERRRKQQAMMFEKLQQQQVDDDQKPHVKKQETAAPLIRIKAKRKRVELSAAEGGNTQQPRPELPPNGVAASFNKTKVAFNDKSDSNPIEWKSEAKEDQGGLGSLLGGYGSDSDSD